MTSPFHFTSSILSLSLFQCIFYTFKQGTNHMFLPLLFYCCCCQNYCCCRLFLWPFVFNHKTKIKKSFRSHGVPYVRNVRSIAMRNFDFGSLTVFIFFFFLPQQQSSKQRKLIFFFFSFNIKNHGKFALGQVKIVLVHLSWDKKHVFFRIFFNFLHFVCVSFSLSHSVQLLRVCL